MHGQKGIVKEKKRELKQSNIILMIQKKIGVVVYNKFFTKFTNINWLTKHACKTKVNYVIYVVMIEYTLYVVSLNNIM